MNRKIVIILVLTSLSIPSHAQLFKKIVKGLADIAGEALMGAVGSYVENSGDEKMKSDWKNITADYHPTNTYGFTTGSQLVNGDYTGAIISSLSAGAKAAGVDEKLVALGNHGITSVINGDNRSAMIDATEFVGTVAGVKGTEQVCETQRNINQINQEYRQNIKNGMSIEEASRIRNAKMATVIVSFTDDMEGLHKEAQRESARKKREELRDGIMRRGYNEMEADYYSSIIISSEFDEHNPSSINTVLNAYIGYKDPSSENSFFDDGYDAPTDNVVKNTPVVAEEQPKSKPLPVVDERANAVKSIEGKVLDNYTLGVVELSSVQKATLDQIADKMNQFKDINIVIYGHTCNIGTLKTNQSIGERRADEAKNYLMVKGVSGLRIAVESRDYSDPVVENDNEEHRKQNRRVTFEVK